MPQFKNEGQWRGEFIVSEGPGSISRDQGVLTAAIAQKVVSGMLVGIVTTGGKYKLYDPAAATGEQTIAGLLITEACDNSLGVAAADFKVAILSRMAQVNQSEVQWYKNVAGVVTALSGGEQTTAIAALKALNIIVRPTD